MVSSSMKHWKKRNHAEITHHFIFEFRKRTCWCILFSERSAVCMYSPEKVQQAVEEITAALGERQLREKSIYQYRLHYQEFIAYIKT